MCEQRKWKFFRYSLAYWPPDMSPLDVFCKKVIGHNKKGHWTKFSMDIGHGDPQIHWTPESWCAGTITPRQKKPLDHAI